MGYRMFYVVLSAGFYIWVVVCEVGSRSVGLVYKRWRCGIEGSVVVTVKGEVCLSVYLST